MTEKNRSTLKYTVSFAVLVVMLFVFYLFTHVLYQNKIIYGVYAGEIYIGNMSPKEAINKLEKISKEFQNETIKLEFNKNNWEIKPSALKAKLDSKYISSNAAKVGKDKELLSNLFTRFRLIFSKQTIEAKINYDEKSLNKLIDKISSDVDLKPVNPTVKFENNTAMPVKGKKGKVIDKKLFVKDLSESVISPSDNIVKIKLTIASPEISFKNAKKAAENANVMISAPLSFKYKDGQWEIKKDKIKSFIEFKEERKNNILFINARFDKDGVGSYIHENTKNLIKEPKDAKFTVSGRNVSIIPSVNGVKIDLNNAVRALEKASLNENSDQRIVVLKEMNAKPSRTTEDAKKMGIKERISTFTTYYSPSARSRVSNIHLLTKSLDGTIVAPGEVFSFNNSIGPRTASKGYKEAPIILNGKLVPGLGGGVCQVATTVFNSIFFAGLPVNQRRNHSFYISKYPAGRDATVSYPWPDLSFRNDTGKHILIKGFVTSGSVTISFFGTDTDRTVKYSTTPFSNFTAFPTERIPDPAMDKGKERIEDKGQQGRSVTVVRMVYRNGKLLFKDTFFSKYSTKTQIVRYGTKESTPTTSASKSPTTSKNR